MAMNKLRGEWVTLCRSVRLLSQYMPRFFVWLLLHGALMAVLPYVTVGLFASLADAVWLADAQRAWMIASVALPIVSVLLLSEAASRRVKEAKWDMLYRAVDRMLTDKLLSMDQADREDPLVNKRLDAIREATASLGVGIVRLPDMVQHACGGVVGTVAALWVSFRTLSLPLTWESMGVLLLWTATLLLSVVIAQRASCPSEEDSRTIADVDRAFYAFLETAEDPTRAADMRLYRQDRTVASYLAKAEKRFFEKQGVKYRRAHGGNAFLRALCTACPCLWVGGCAACLLAGVSAGYIGFGALIAAVGAWCLLPRELGRIVSAVRERTRSLPYAAMLLAFLNRPPRLYRGSLTTEKRRDGAYELELRHVSFTYPSQTEPAVSDVSLRLVSGSRTAIVGENGSGKSTLIKLLCRLYDPDEGEILLNGIDIRKYRYEEYLELIAAVFQDPPFLGDVARDASRTPERWAGAVERALKKDAPFLLLDEPMAFADPEEEAMLYAELLRLPRRKTAVMVSHRPASCRFSETIVVMEHGRIAEQGSHDELLSRDGKYRAMWCAGTGCDNEHTRRR